MQHNSRESDEDLVFTVSQDIERTREVYTECLKLVPHKIFSFAKLWGMCASFEVRQKDITAARKVFGNAIGMAPKAKLFQAYIQLEWQLGSIPTTSF
jgi:crooked neck